MVAIAKTVFDIYTSIAPSLFCMDIMSYNGAAEEHNAYCNGNMPTTSRKVNINLHKHPSTTLNSSYTKLHQKYKPPPTTQHFKALHRNCPKLGKVTQICITILGNILEFYAFLFRKKMKCFPL